MWRYWYQALIHNQVNLIEMRLINQYYFYGDLGIAQISQATVIATIGWYIDKYENPFLRDLLGQDLFAAYKAGTENPTTGNALPENEVEQKWKNLRDGKEYTNRRGVKTWFYGIARKTESSYKQSPIANYVYYRIVRAMSSQSSGTGETVLAIENGANVSSIDKQCFAWNQMVEMNIALYDFLLSNETDYPEFSSYVYQANHDFLTTINGVL